VIERRDLFKILGAVWMSPGESAAQHAHVVTAPPDIAHYKPRFFSDREYAAVDSLTEIVIPADEQSPGAHAVGVRFYIDTLVFRSDQKVQERWRAGLAAVDEAARATFAKGFADCSGEQQEKVVAQMARNETAPTTELERFFRVLKSLTLDAFVLSEAGMNEYLGYKGNIAVPDFAGCTHPEHRRG